MWIWWLPLWKPYGNRAVYMPFPEKSRKRERTIFYLFISILHHSNRLFDDDYDDDDDDDDDECALHLLYTVLSVLGINYV